MNIYMYNCRPIAQLSEFLHAPLSSLSIKFEAFLHVPLGDQAFVLRHVEANRRLVDIDSQDLPRQGDLLFKAVPPLPHTPRLGCARKRVLGGGSGDMGAGNGALLN